MTSLNYTISIIILIGATFFSFFEIGSSFYIINTKNLNLELREHLKQFNFLTYDEKKERINDIQSNRENLNYPILNHNNDFELGKTNMLLGLESTDPETKIKNICSARTYFYKAAQKNPKNINYQLAIADIESLSPSLPQTCDSALNQNLNTLSLEKRMDLIKKLAPLDPPTLYKSALIHKAKGDRISAMKDFRKFEENILKSTFEFRKYLLFQPLTEEELKEILPRKLPNILVWLSEYSKNPNENINYFPIFESVIKETLELENKKTNKESLSKKTLLDLFWSEEIQKSDQIKNTLSKLIYKDLTLNDGKKSTKDLFKIISNSSRVSTLITNNLSSISKKFSQSYNWKTHNSPNPINLDIKSGGLGVYIPSSSNPDSLIIQGEKSSKLPKDLRIEIWTSNDNKTYIQTENLKPEIIDEIGNNSIFLYNIPNLNAKYLKIYFNFNEKNTAKLTAPIHTAIQFYELK